MEPAHPSRASWSGAARSICDIARCRGDSWPCQAPKTRECSVQQTFHEDRDTEATRGSGARAAPLAGGGRGDSLIQAAGVGQAGVTDRPNKRTIEEEPEPLVCFQLTAPPVLLVF